jgi:S1-C subfamily serine protease
MNHSNLKRVLPIPLFGLLVFLVSLACRSPFQTTIPQVVVTVIPPTAIVQQVPAPVSMPAVVTNEEEALKALYAQVNPSVVNLTIYLSQNNQMLPASQGSGFVYDPEGHVVTNAHVVHGAEQIDVIFSDGTIRPADIVGEDLHSDLAVVQVENFPAGIVPLPLGNMSDLAVGENVVAIGNPFGLEGTLTRGIISALGRTIPALTTFSIPQSIQTDAAINPGNSGGPLLNLNGEVIGVNAQIETGNGNNANSGVGFAIPVSIVKRIVPSLIQSGGYDWPWLGVRGQSLDLALIKAMDLPFEKGAYLWQVIDQGPSAKAGLVGSNKTVEYDGRPVDVGGDVVTAVDGQPVESFDDLLVYVSFDGTPGQDVTLTIWRDGQYKDVKVTLEKRPDQVPQQP